MVSPVGIDHGKARPKADAVWLIPPGERIRDECREVPFDSQSHRLAVRLLTQDIRPVDGLP